MRVGSLTLRPSWGNHAKVRMLPYLVVYVCVLETMVTDKNCKYLEVVHGVLNCSALTDFLSSIRFFIVLRFLRFICSLFFFSAHCWGYLVGMIMIF